MTSSPVPAAAPLRARTVRLDQADADLLAFAGDDGLLFERDGCGLATRGVAARVAATDAADALAAIECDDEVGRPGTGPVAIGALPFTATATGLLTIPASVLGRASNGTTWLTTIGAGAAPVEARPAGQPPDGFTLRSTRSHADWCDLIASAVAEIRTGAFRKVVLAREVLVEANRPIIPSDVLGRLRALYPSCTLFAVDGFIGASPELLVSRTGGEVRSHPLAGTIPRSGDPAVDARLGEGLLASAKDREEHRLVVEAVAEVLDRWCRPLEVPAIPSIVPLRNVSHLGTLLRGRLREDAPDSAPTVLELALALHPTPAVGGSPTAAALAWLTGAEGLDRGHYAGPVGWMDSSGDGEWVVGIRAAELDGATARLVAGVGVVADSDPAAELAETQLKLQALLAAVVRP